MVFIKVPKDAAPGEILGVTIENTFTTCTRCGKTFSMNEIEGFPFKEDAGNGTDSDTGRT